MMRILPIQDRGIATKAYKRKKENRAPNEYMPYVISGKIIK